jgi:hypothetical protein
MKPPGDSAVTPTFASFTRFSSLWSRVMRNGWELLWFSSSDRDPAPFYSRFEETGGDFLGFLIQPVSLDKLGDLLASVLAQGKILSGSRGPKKEVQTTTRDTVATS